MAGVAVWLGGYLSGSYNYANSNLFWACLAIALICGAGNAHNDYLDIEVDKVNHPRRPLPMGELPPYVAMLTAFVLSFFGIIAAIVAGLPVLAAIILYIISLALYNSHLKRFPLWGNLTVSVMGGATFLVGGLAVSLSTLFDFPGSAVPALFAFLMHFGREIVKDTADVKGDRVAGYITFPARVGERAALLSISIIFSILIGLTFVAIIYGWYRPVFWIITVFLIDLPLVVAVVYLWVSQDVRRFTIAGSLFKILMILGLAAFGLGKS
jgi:geranylgeranylglycerol-phosphate geranylgeranyltransferase